MALADEALEFVADTESLSFYGLSEGLAQVQKLLERAEQAESAKAPTAESLAILDRKEDLLAAQSTLRKSMGALLEEPNLTKREKPLAESFLRAQLNKAKKSDRGSKIVGRLEELMNEVAKAAPVTESREVRRVEASIKELEAEWKEVSPLYDKWQAGRHTFKSNAELQSFRRKYEDCRKARDSSGTTLEKALCKRRDEEAEKKAAKAEASAKASGIGWAAAAKKPAVGKAAAKTTATVRRAPPPAPSNSSWGASVMSLAQRLRAEAGASVRREAEASQQVANDDAAEDEEGSEDEAGLPSPPPVPKAKAKVSAKPPPPLPPQPSSESQGGGFQAVKASKGKAAKVPNGAAAATAAARAREEESDDGDEEEEAAAGEDPHSSQTNGKTNMSTSSSAKKKSGKAKKRKGGGGDLAGAAMPPGNAAAPKKGPEVASWVQTVRKAMSDSLVEELMSRDAWQLADSEESAVSRLATLATRLPLLNPLGLPLPFEWSEFVSLEFDGGPKRTSKRGTSPWVLRLEKTIPYLLGHYLTIIFALCWAHSLSHFGLMVLTSGMQVGLLLTPSEVFAKKLPPTAQPLLLQVAHMLLWISFLRAIWMMHLFIKMFTIAGIGIHAYVLADVAP